MDILAITPKYRNNDKFDYSLLLLDILDPRKENFTYVKKWDPLKWHTNILKSECENMLQKVSDAGVTTVTPQTIKDADKKLFRKLRRIPKKDQNGNIDYLGIFQELWVRWWEKFTREVGNLHRGKDEETRNKIRIKTLNDFFKKFFEHLDVSWKASFSPYDIKNFDTNMYESINYRYYNNSLLNEKKMFDDIHLPNKSFYEFDYKPGKEQFYLKKIVNYLTWNNPDYKGFTDLISKEKFKIFFEKMETRWVKKWSPNTIIKLFPNLYTFLVNQYQAPKPYTKIDRFYIWAHILTQEQREKYKFEHLWKKYWFKNGNKLLLKHQELDLQLLNHYEHPWSKNPEELLIDEEKKEEEQAKIDKILKAIEWLEPTEKQSILWFLSGNNISEEGFSTIVQKLKILIPPERDD